MAHSSFTITESAKEIAAHERTATEAERQRFALLRLLAGGVPISDAAAQLGVSERTARRWWKLYQRYGLAGLVNEKSVMVNTSKESPAQWRRDKSVELLIPDRVLTFMNSIPEFDGDALDWMLKFKHALEDFLGEVGRVSLHLCIARSGPDKNRKGISMFEHLVPDDEAPLRHSKSRYLGSESRIDAILEDFSQLGYPLDQFQPPIPFIYENAAGIDLATIILWQRLDKPPISETILQTVAVLEPFLLRTFSSVILIRRLQEPMDSFYESLHHLWKDADLSKQEKRILHHRLHGYSYREIADQVTLSVATVKKHIWSIHKKTGTSTHAELVAKYFSPRTFPFTRQDSESDEDE